MITENNGEHFTVEQYHGLNGEQQQALEAVAEYLTGDCLPIEEVAQSLNILRPCKGCVPAEEIDEELTRSIRRKFGAIYQVGMELAEQELKKQGMKQPDDFSFCMVADPSYEDCTHIAILDYQKPVFYLHEWNKAWSFNFETLAHVADEVLRIKNTLVDKVVEASKPKKLMIVIEQGQVRELVDFPEGYQVTVINYDVEDMEPEQLQLSPLDQELCLITKGNQCTPTPSKKCSRLSDQP